MRQRSGIFLSFLFYTTLSTSLWAMPDHEESVDSLLATLQTALGGHYKLSVYSLDLDRNELTPISSPREREQSRPKNERPPLKSSDQELSVRLIERLIDSARDPSFSLDKKEGFYSRAINYGNMCLSWEPNKDFPKISNVLPQLDLPKIQKLSPDLLNVRRLSQKQPETEEEFYKSELLSLIFEAYDGFISDLSNVHLKVGSENYQDFSKTAHEKIMTLCLEGLTTLKELYKYEFNAEADWKYAFLSKVNRIIKVRNCAFLSHFLLLKNTKTPHEIHQVPLQLKEEFSAICKNLENLGIDSQDTRDQMNVLKNEFTETLSFLKLNPHHIDQNAQTRRIYEEFEPRRSPWLSARGQILLWLTKLLRVESDKKFIEIAEKIEEICWSVSEKNKEEEPLLLKDAYEVFPDLFSKSTNFEDYMPSLIMAFCRINDLNSALARAEAFYSLDCLNYAQKKVAKYYRAFVKNLWGDPEELDLFLEEQQSLSKRESLTPKKQKARAQKNAVLAAKKNTSLRSSQTVKAIEKVRGPVEFSSIQPALRPYFGDVEPSSPEEKKAKQERHQRALAAKTRMQPPEKQQSLSMQENSLPVVPKVVVQDQKNQNHTTSQAMYGDTKGILRKIHKEIDRDTWKITRDEMEQYFIKMGCSLSKKGGKGSHEKIFFPEITSVRDRSDKLVTILSGDENLAPSQKEGGALTFPRWGKIVPPYLRKQILCAQEKLAQASR